MFAASVRVPPAKIAATAKSRGACGPSFVFLARPRSCDALKSPRNATGIAMTNLHRSPPMNQSETDLGIVNESQLLGFGIRSPARIAFSSTYACGLVAFFALLFRSPDLFRHPRFWAEEATLYVSAAWNFGIGVMLAVFNGNYQFLVNLSAYFASLVPYRFSPYVTTYISLAAIILVSVVFSVALSRRKISPWLVFIFVVTLALLPGGYEI